MENQIEEKFLRKGRWFVKLSSKINGVFTLPYANYIWLKGNPSFLGIPRGYVVHHLDDDEANDSISNLVIMQKHHHAAYHFSRKIIKPEVKFIDASPYQERTVYFPTRKPWICQRKNGRYYLQFKELMGGEWKVTNLCLWEGRSLINREMAEKVRAEIWPEVRSGGGGRDENGGEQNETSNTG